MGSGVHAWLIISFLLAASVAWSLHRDLGFPLDLVDLILEERGVRVDRQELDRLIAENQKVGLNSPVLIWKQ